MLLIQDLDDPLQCPECNYRGEKSQNVARHLGLVHSRLDSLLSDKELVARRKEEYLAKPNKISIGSECPGKIGKLSPTSPLEHTCYIF